MGNNVALGLNSTESNQPNKMVEQYLNLMKQKAATSNNNKFERSPQSDEANLSKPQVSKADDGYISALEKAKSFGKGIISPITSMFSSKINFLIGAGMLAGGAALCAAIPPAAALLVPIFIGIGAFQIATGTYKASFAKNDAEAKRAWEKLGEGTAAIGLSIAGAKSSLSQAQSAGIKVSSGVENLNPITATIETFKLIPQLLSKSGSIIKNGEFITYFIGSLNNWFRAKPKQKPERQVNTNEPQPNSEGQRPKSAVERIKPEDNEQLKRTIEQVKSDIRSDELQRATTSPTKTLKPEDGNLETAILNRLNSEETIDPSTLWDMKDYCQLNENYGLLAEVWKNQIKISTEISHIQDSLIGSGEDGLIHCYQKMGYRQDHPIVQDSLKIISDKIREIGTAEHYDPNFIDSNIKTAEDIFKKLPE